MQYLTNDFGISFEIHKIPLGNRPDIIDTFYVCLNCGIKYRSKYSAKHHNCQQNSNNSNINIPINYDKALKFLMIWISKKNITFNSIFDSDFDGFLKNINPNFNMIPESTMRYKIHQFSEDIKLKIFQKINGLPVSILIDGVKKCANKYQGQILFTPKQIFFLGLTECEEETAENISKIIADTAKSISLYGGHLVSVCTDNFSSNIKALDGGPDSAQAKSNQFFFRSPCACHTLNLSIKDNFDDKYKNIKENVIQFLKYFKEISEDDRRFGHFPEFKEIRWYSLSTCVSFIISHRIFLDPYYLAKYNEIQILYDWSYIDEILKSLKILMEKFENDSSSIADIFINLKITIKQLMKINELNPRNKSNNIAEDMINSILNRFTTTANLKLPILAFFFTGKGLQYFNEIDDQALILFETAKDTFEEYLSNNIHKKELLQFFKYFVQFRKQTFLISQNTTQESFDFWENISKGGTFWSIEPQLINDKNDHYKNISKLFARIAIEILTVPCSEATCERAFSHLGDILMNNKRNLSFEMLNSLLIIRMNSIFIHQNEQNSNNFMINELPQLLQDDLIEEDLIYAENPLTNF